MLFLLVGVNIKAQFIANELMYERFNDGTKMLYGWFAEGWKIDDDSVHDAVSISFEGDIFTPSSTVNGIISTIKTIDNDNTIRYSDLQDRLLNG